MKEYFKQVQSRYNYFCYSVFMTSRIWPPSPGLALFGFSLSLCLFLAPYHLSSPDSELYFRTAQSLASFKGLAIQPLESETLPVVDESGRIVQKKFDTFGTKTGLNGLEYSQYGIGLPLVCVPFYWFAEATELLVPFPMNWWRRICVSVVNCFVTALLAWVVFCWAVSVTRDTRAGLIAGLLFATATYGFAQSKYVYSEPLAALFLMASAWLLDEDRNNTRMLRLLLAGALAGLAILTRLDSLVAGLGFIALLWWPKPGETINPGASIRKTLIAGIPVMAALGIFVLLNYLRYGDPLATGYGDQAEGFHFDTSLREGLVGLLFSSGRGLFIYSPIFILTPIALFRLGRIRSVTAWAIVAVSAGYILAMAKWQNWEGGWCWGPRHICQIAPFWAVPLAALFMKDSKWGSPKRIGMGVLITLSVLIQFLALSQDAVEVYRSLNPAIHPKTLFDPAYSPMRFHWLNLIRGEHDFGLPTLLRDAPALGTGYLLLLGAGMVYSILGLMRNLRGEKSQSS